MPGGFVIEVQVGKVVFEQLEQGFNKLAQDLYDAADSASVPVSRAMRDTLQRVAKQMAEKHSAGWNGQLKNPTPFLQRRSGGALDSMKNSIHVKGSGALEDVAGEISTGFYAIHETGGTVRATRSKYLTIPLPGAMNSDGTPIKARARQWDNTFVARSRRGNLLIFQKRGSRGVVPLYLLKESVTIPARLKMQDAITGDALPYFERRAFDILERHILRSFE